MRSFITKIFLAIFAIFSVLVCINAVYGGNQREEYQKAIRSVLEQSDKYHVECRNKTKNVIEYWKAFYKKVDSISLHNCPPDFIDVFYKFKANTRRVSELEEYFSKYINECKEKMKREMEYKPMTFLGKYFNGDVHMQIDKIEDYYKKYTADLSRKCLETVHELRRVSEKYGVDVTKYKCLR